MSPLPILFGYETHRLDFSNCQGEIGAPTPPSKRVTAQPIHSGRYFCGYAVGAQWGALFRLKRQSTSRRRDSGCVRKGKEKISPECTPTKAHTPDCSKEGTEGGLFLADKNIRELEDQKGHLQLC